tara:strand:- start:962255 stop:962383 length:129 start_codon:yes stop_codon:yes gene_type:complete
MRAMFLLDKARVSDLYFGGFTHVLRRFGAITRRNACVDVRMA